MKIEEFGRVKMSCPLCDEDILELKCQLCAKPFERYEYLCNNNNTHICFECFEILNTTKIFP